MKRHRKFSFLLGEGSQHRGHSLGVNSVAHSSDGRVVTAGRDATVRVWENGCVVSVYSDHADAVHDVTFVPASGAIVSCSSDNTIRVHNGKVVDERVTHCDAVRKVKMVSSTTLVSASLDGTVCMHDLRSSASTPTVVNMADPLFALAVGANEGKYMIVAGSAKGNIYMFDPRASLPCVDDTLPPIIRSAHKACIRDLTFCDGGTKIVSCGADSCVRIWDTRLMRSALTYVLHTDAVFTTSTVPSASTIVLSGSRDGTVAATNIRTLHTSRIVSAAHPVTHVSVSPRNVLYMCTTRSTVDAFVLSNVMHNDLASQQPSASIGLSPDSMYAGNDVITPSKVSIDLDTSPDHTVAHPPTTSVGPLCLVDPIGRRYESPYLRAIKFASPEEESRWCTSSEIQRPQGLTTSEPDIALTGSTHALVQCTLLNDKRHVLSLDEANEIVLWNICDQQMVHKFPRGTTMKDALEHSQVETHCSSWCTVECRWGALCVTLSFESSLDTFVNKWWMRYVRPPMSTERKSTPPSIASCRSELSIYRIPRKDRADLLQQPLLNLCEIALGNLFEGSRDHSVVVWFVPGGAAPQGTGKRFVLSEESDETIMKVVPSWVASVLINPKQLIVASLTAAHAVELLPYPGGSLPALKQAQNNIPKRKALAELAIELVSVLKLKVPKTRDLLEQLARCSSSVPQRSNTNNNGTSGALGFPYGNEDPQEAALTALQPDEFIEFLPAGDDGQPNSAIVIDPMMLIGTIFFLYKEKGSGVLRLWYRRNSLLPS